MYEIRVTNKGVRAMKTLLLGLLLLCGDVLAGEVAYLKNNEGGQMVFTDAVCPYNEKFMIVHTAASDGKFFYGCWTAADSYVFVEWQDGDKRRYEMRNLTPGPALKKHRTEQKSQF